MENKIKYIYMISGVVIGVGIMLIISALFTGKSSTELSAAARYQEQHGDDKDAEESIKLTDSEMKELGIILDTVGPQKLQMHTDLTGEIVPDPDKVVHIIPRFTGVVKNVYMEIGDRVKKNEVIAVIESNESLVTYEVKSSIKGIVQELHMTPGELVGDDKHVVTIANLNSVWAELNVYQKDLDKIKTGQSAQVYFNRKDNAANGKIFYLSPTVDEHTRTAIARVRLNNSNGLWKPGMFITATVLTDFAEVSKAVTFNSIQNFEGQKVVFVREDNGFRPRPVTIGKSNTKYIEVLNGLNSGQTFVAEGAFVIKSELLKESFGGGHGH